MCLKIADFCPVLSLIGSQMAASKSTAASSPIFPESGIEPVVARRLCQPALLILSRCPLDSSNQPFVRPSRVGKGTSLSFYSARKAIAGSMLAARKDGNTQAASATATSSTPDATYAMASNAEMPKSRFDTRLERLVAITIPMPMPRPTSFIASFTTIKTTRPRPDPKAKRIPSSMQPSSTRPVRPRTPAASAIRRCIRPRKAISGISA